MALLSGCHSGQANQTEKPLVKVCGITAPAELDVLRAHRVDFVGLWWGVPGGPHDLDRERGPRSRTPRPRPACSRRCS